jgi:ElaB/YqjD/DUF883 family membrane-anchored ribosome-binding protein
MGETIDALQERLSPDRIKEKVKDQAADAYQSAKDAVKRATIGKAEKVMNRVSDTVGDATRDAGAAVRDTGSSIFGTIRNNPLPFALIGAGIGMLTWKRRRDSGERAYSAGREYRAGYYAEDQAYAADPYEETADGPSMTERAREAAGSIAGRAQEATRGVRDTARRAAGRTREQVSHVGQQARYSARRTGDNVSDMLRTNPLAVGAAVLAGGAAVGLALPVSRAEQEYMGEARDQFMEKAESVAKDTMDKVKRVAEETTRTAKQEAQNQGLTGS